MNLVPKEIGTRRELWIARAVTWQVVGKPFPYYGDLRWLWVTRSPTHEAWAGQAVCSKVRYRMNSVQKEIGTRRELWIAQEVTWQVVGNTVSVLWRLEVALGDPLSDA